MITILRVGIIGCGKIAQVRHIPEYLDNEHAQIAGFYDRSMERAQEMARKFGGKVYKSYHELLENGEIDAVSVCVPNNLHAEVTIAALQAGKHVLCEKPMATTLQECEDMVVTAEATGKKLLIGHNQILTPAHKRAKELIHNGLIGEILTFRTTFGHGGPENWSINPGPNTWFFDKNTAAMGAIADPGIHKVYLIQYLTGQRITEATAKLITINKRDPSGQLISLDDNAFCIYGMENGIAGTMTASWTYYGSEDNSTVLYGTKGIMRIYDDPQYSIVVILKNGEKIYYSIDSIQTNEKQTKSGVIDEFIESVLEDKESELSGKKALDAMRAIFASIESSNTKKTVFV